MNDFYSEAEKLFKMDEKQLGEYFNDADKKQDSLYAIDKVMLNFKQFILAELENDISPRSLLFIYLVTLGEMAAMIGMPESTSIPGKIFAKGYASGKKKVQPTQQKKDDHAN